MEATLHSKGYGAGIVDRFHPNICFLSVPFSWIMIVVKMSCGVTCCQSALFIPTLVCHYDSD